MKKIILALFILISVVSFSKAQGLTDTLGNTKRSITDIYNEIYGTSISSMSTICQSYTVAISTVDDTSKIRMSIEDDFGSSWIQTGKDKYIGKFIATNVPDMWLKAYYTVASTFQYTFKFIEIK